MICPSCQSENDDGAEVCFQCRAVLAAVTRDALVGGRYRIVAPLGRGGMGAVYHARDETLGEDVALKILRPDVAGTPEMAARFRSEIKLARRVSHWNVCRIHEYGEDGALRYISMELIRGSTLKERLRDGPLTSRAALDVAVQVAEGLAAIHKAGIVHRDLKSANVMIAADGTAKLMDFGIAKAMADERSGSTTGYVLGSPEYMSPEQARGRPAELRSDLYSLGVVTFEAFTGHVPFRGTTPVATLMMHVEAPPPVDDPALPIPERVRGVLRRALAKDPAERYPDATAMAAALREAHALTGQAAPGPTGVIEVTRRVPVTSRSWRGPVAGAAVIAVALAVTAALLRQRSPEPSPPAPAEAARVTSTTTAATTTTTPPSAGDGRPTSRPSARAPVPPPSATTAMVEPPTASPAVPSPLMPSAEPDVVAPRPSEPPPSATAPPPTPEPAREGWLLVLPTPWAEVTIDGRTLGPTPFPRVPLAPGVHSIVLAHPDYQPFARKVTIRPGEQFTLKLDFATEGVRRRR